MELLHSHADGIVRPERRRGRTFRRVALVLLAAVAAAGFGAHAAYADPTVGLTLDQTSIPNNGSVTMTMTISSSLAHPSGSVAFVNAAVPGTPLATVNLPPTGPTSITVMSPSFTFSSPPTSYSLYAIYIPDGTAFVLGLAKTQSATQTLTVAGTPAKPATGVTLSSSSLDVDTTTPVTLTATVAELAPGGSVPTGTVSFSDVSSGSSVPLGTKPLVDGSAQLVVSTFAAGEHRLVASYSGSEADKASSSDPPLVLSSHPPADPRLKTTALVTLLPPRIALGDTATIVATISQSGASSTSTPPGGQVTFSSTSDLGQDVILGQAALGTVPDGSGLTPHPDQAVIQVSTWERAADYVITASYIGDIFFNGSASEPRTLTVLPRGAQGMSQPSVTVGVSGNVLATGGVTLTGTLLDDATPIAGRTLTLSIGGVSCDAVTDANGVASCSPAGVPTLGPTTSIASFAGDDFYLPADASAAALLYALAPGGGSFAIGDLDATIGTAVTFWGSQWWKLNTLSGSGAPSSFKGFAAYPASAACGTSWKTDPGNSTPPPAGPLPAYMVVIATSAASKSGSTISGTTAHVVIVKTAPGYDANPGHAGTGTVVATVC